MAHSSTIPVVLLIGKTLRVRCCPSIEVGKPTNTSRARCTVYLVQGGVSFVSSSLGSDCCRNSRCKRDSALGWSHQRGSPGHSSAVLVLRAASTFWRCALVIGRTTDMNKAVSQRNVHVEYCGSEQVLAMCPPLEQTQTAVAYCCPHGRYVVFLSVVSLIRSESTWPKTACCPWCNIRHGRYVVLLSAVAL